jgi:hypothetical protein
MASREEAYNVWKKWVMENVTKDPTGIEQAVQVIFETLGKGLGLEAAQEAARKTTSTSSETTMESREKLFREQRANIKPIAQISESLPKLDESALRLKWAKEIGPNVSAEQRILAIQVAVAAQMQGATDREAANAAIVAIHDPAKAPYVMRTPKEAKLPNPSGKRSLLTGIISLLGVIILFSIQKKGLAIIYVPTGFGIFTGIKGLDYSNKSLAIVGLFLSGTAILLTTFLLFIH